MEEKTQMDPGKQFTEWLTDRELSQSTIDSYGYTIRDFFEKYPELTKKNLIDYKNYLIRCWNPKTVNLRITALNQYCVFAGKSDLKLKKIKVQAMTSVENVISRAEYESLIAGLLKDKNMKGYFMIKFLAKTGARCSEFIQFKKSDLEHGYCEIWTKGKIRRINFPDAIKEKTDDQEINRKGVQPDKNTIEEGW